MRLAEINRQFGARDLFGTQQMCRTPLLGRSPLALAGVAQGRFLVPRVGAGQGRVTVLHTPTMNRSLAGGLGYQPDPHLGSLYQTHD